MLWLKMRKIKVNLMFFWIFSIVNLDKLSTFAQQFVFFSRKVAKYADV